MQIRQMLAVPDSFRMVQQNSPVRRDVIAAGDAWARRRVRELEMAGIAAEVRRYRKKEPLCVVYRTSG